MSVNSSEMEQHWTNFFGHLDHYWTSIGPISFTVRDAIQCVTSTQNVADIQLPLLVITVLFPVFICGEQQTSLLLSILSVHIGICVCTLFLEFDWSILIKFTPFLVFRYFCPVLVCVRA